MKDITGLVGREPLVEQIAREARKGRHLLLTGPVGIGKSAVLEAALDHLLPRQRRIVIQVSEHEGKTRNGNLRTLSRHGEVYRP
jgi:MoxR-like ATPase